MQEASTIIKAIEQGWKKAGAPNSFSVKIFEHPQKNFFGITTHSAKVGIFFEEQAPSPKREFKKPERLKIQKPERKPEANELPKKQEPREFWTQEMIDIAKNWLNGSIKALEVSDVSYIAEPSNHQLRVKFNKPLINETEREKQLFRNFAFLMLQTLRHKLKRPLRGFKVVLLSEGYDSSSR